MALTLFSRESAFAQGRRPAGPALAPSFIEESESFLFRSVEDDHGGFYALWTHEAEPRAFTLTAQHVNDQGEALWGPRGKSIALHLTPADNWDVFPDGQGGLAATWIQDGTTRAQRYTADGKTQWPENAMVTVSSVSCKAPTGVADALGGAYLVWSEKDYPDRWVLVAQHMNPQGQESWGPTGIRVSLRPSEQRHPRAVFDGQAGVIVAWKDFRESSSQVQVQRLDFGGNRLWGNPGVVVTAPAGPSHEAPILVPLGGGEAVAAWVAQQSGKNRLFLQSMNASGAFRWASQGINITFGDWDQWNPVLYGDGHGSIWTGWEDFRNGAHWQVYLGNVNSDAHIVWPGGEVALAPYTADQGQLAIVDDGRKGVFGAWVDNRLGRPGLYAQEVDDQGHLLMGPQGSAIATNLVNPGIPKIINLASSRAAVFWVDRQKKNRWALYWTPLEGPSPQAPPKPYKSGINHETLASPPVAGGVVHY